MPPKQNTPTARHGFMSEGKTIPTKADDLKMVIIGSFQSLSSARQVKDRLMDVLGMDADILATRIRSSTWYRVIIVHQDAPSLVLALEQKGFENAWFLDNAVSAE